MPPVSLIRTSRGLVAAIAVIWLGVVAVGVRSLLAYAYTPGAVAPAPAAWPVAGGAFPGGSSLVMFVHPHCPCSRASIHELAAAMATAGSRLKARVYVELPDGMSPGWERGELWRLAAAIPGVEVITDAGGRAAVAFQASVSGQAHLYDSDQRLIFSGGLTPARGHEGDNAGRRAIQAHLEGRINDAALAPAFGCYLQAASTSEPALPQ
jgi:hypothetical protein